jgi:hypothetical protein
MVDRAESRETVEAFVLTREKTGLGWVQELPLHPKTKQPVTVGGDPLPFTPLQHQQLLNWLNDVSPKGNGGGKMVKIGNVSYFQGTK